MRDPGQIQESAPAYGEQRNANRDYVVVMYVISIHQKVKRKNKQKRFKMTVFLILDE